MLHQRKKQRENEIIPQNNNSADGISQIKKRLDKELNADVRFNYKDNPNGRKISDVVLEMIRPLLEEANTFEEEQNIAGLGVIAWNLGVIKENNGKKEMLKNLKDLDLGLPKQIQNVLLDYCEIKIKNYSEYNELIIAYEFTKINDTHNNLTVSYKLINE